MSNMPLKKSDVKFLLLEGIHKSAVSFLKNAGFSNVEYCASSLSEDELKDKISEVHIVGIRSRTIISEEILCCANNLIAVGCFCIGTNQVDLDAAGRKGIAVFNAPHSNTRSVAELVIGQIIFLMRGLIKKNSSCHSGGWLKGAVNSHEIRGKKLGIVGYGAIGSQLSVLAEGMGLDVYFYDVVAKLPIGNAKKVSTLHEMLSFVDIVSLHVPDIPETHLIMGESEFAVLKKGAMIINAARGSLVDIPCLVQALKSGSLGGAAIDVFPTEPLSNEDDFVSPLQGIDNVILTPHIGGSTIEAQFNIGLEVASKLAAYCDSNANITPINHATLSWAEQICRHQILPLLQDIGTEALN